jgi:hypothetical protein
MRASLWIVLLGALAGCSSATGSAGDDDVAGDGGSGDGDPGRTIRFVVLGDTGSGNDQRAVAAAMRDICAGRGCDFALLLGDNLDDGGPDNVDDPAFQARFEEPYADLDLPFYVALGNHDYGGRLIVDVPGLGNQFDKGSFEIDYADRSQKWRMPAAHYSFRVGPVAMIVLDTNSLMWGNSDHGDQRTWWPTALDDVAGSPWVFVAGHHPYRSNGTHGNAGSYDAPELNGIAVPNPLPIQNGHEVQAFFDDVVCGTGAAYFAAHDDAREWLDEPDALCGTELIVSGAGAKVTPLVGRGAEDNAVHYADDHDPGFLFVEVAGDLMTGQFYDSAGNVDFERTVKRPGS